MTQEQITKIENVLNQNNVSINDIEGYLQEKRNLRLVDSGALEEVKQALFDEVGNEGWKVEWDLL